MASSIDQVYMVEASRELRDTQKALLCGSDAPSTKSEVGVESKSKYSGIPIVWAEGIKSIPTGKFPIPSPTYKAVLAALLTYHKLDRIK